MQSGVVDGTEGVGFDSPIDPLARMDLRALILEAVGRLKQAVVAEMHVEQRSGYLDQAVARTLQAAIIP